MTKKRVVITGLGAVSSCGNNVKDTWDAVKNGKSGISNITLFDSSNHMVKIAGEVKNFSLEPYGVDKKIGRKIGRFSKFLLGASIEAVNDAGFTKETLQNENAGIITGIGIGFSEE